MSLSSDQASVQYTLSGSGQTLTVSFKFLAAADLSVIKTVAGADTALVLNTDYTVTGGGSLPATGAVVMVAGAAADVITIYRNAQILQPAVYAPNDAFPAKTTETSLDRAVMAIQQLALLVKRTLRIPVSGSETTDLGDKATRASKIVGFDANGTAVLFDPSAAVFTTGNGIEVSSVSALKSVAVAGLTTGKQARSSGYASAGDGGDGLWSYNSASSATENLGTVVAPTTGGGRWLRVFDGCNFLVDWFGAKGDGATDDAAAIDACVVAAGLAAVSGVAKVTQHLHAGKTYFVNQRTAAGTSPSVRLVAGVSFDGHGATILKNDNGNILGPDHTYNLSGSYTITANTASGDSSVTVASTAGIAVGNQLGIAYVNGADDPAEPKNWLWAVVTALTSTTISFDIKLPEAMTVASTSASNRKVYAWPSIYENQTIANVNLASTGSATPIYGCYLLRCRNVSVRNLAGNNAGVFFAAQQASNITLENSSYTNGVAYVGTEGSCIDFVNVTTALVKNLYVTNCQNVFFDAESYSTGIAYDGIFVTNNWLLKNGTARVNPRIFGAGGYSQVRANNVVVYGAGTSDALWTITSGHGAFRFSNLAVRTWSQLSVNLSAFDGGQLELDGIILGQKKTISIAFQLGPSLSGSIPGGVRPPRGYFSAMRYYVSSATGVTKFFLVNGNALDCGAPAADTLTDVPNGTDYGPTAINDGVQKDFAIYTDGTCSNRTYAVFQFDYFPIVTNDAVRGDAQATENLVVAATILGSVLGTNTNDSAASGYVGESVYGAIDSGHTVSLTDNTAAAVTSISLTAGDWDVQGSVAYAIGVTTTVKGMVAAINTTSAATGSAGDGKSAIFVYNNATISTAVPPVVVTPVVRISLASTANVYLNTYQQFGVSTMAAYGAITARRVR